MEHFVTLFNRTFLPQGLALYASMERHVREYILWILCVDDATYDVLGQLDLPNVRRLKLRDLETPALLAVKATRTIGEYCWTLTPFAPRFVFEADSAVKRVTYIDADLWFRKHPRTIFDEIDFAGKHVLITDHAYAPEYDQSATSGQYCVQFMTFSRDRGEHVRNWWEERCLEWCFARSEDGKYGDQKYLDDWPERFGDVVHVLQDYELALAPWNASRFPYGSAVFFHFHSLRLISDCKLDIGDYYLPSSLLTNVYRPYFSDLRAAAGQLKRAGYDLIPQAKPISLVQSYSRRLKRLRARILPFLVDSQVRF